LAIAASRVETIALTATLDLDTIGLPDVFAQIADDPTIFGREILGRRHWRAQREMRRAIEHHRRINIRSANGIGKTYQLGEMVIEWALLHPDSRSILTGPTFENTEAGLWQEVRRAFAASKVALPGKMLGCEWRIAPGWDVAIINPKNPSAAQGRRGAGAVFIWIDEAQGVEDVEYWTALDSLCQADASRIVASGNPLGPQGRFFDNASNPAWHNIQLSAFDHPNIGRRPRDPNWQPTEEWVEAGRVVIPGSITRRWVFDKYHEWGPDDHKYVARVLGEFPDAGLNQLITLRMLESCAKITPDVIEAPRAGLDCARNPGTGDKNAIVILDGTRTVVHNEAWHSDDTMAVKDRFIAACRKHDVPPHRAYVDVIGIGAGVVDQSKRDGFPLQPVNYGETATGQWRTVLGREAIHANVKAELHDACRALLKGKLLSIPKKWRALWSDLTEIRFEIDGSGRVKIEDKAKQRERTGRSPDNSDALMVALSNGFAAPSREALRGLSR
jgi:hypothetical protein